MKPIIKWNGGKSQEIKFFQHKIPKEYNRYVEPFMGGGGVFFALEKDNSIINDVNFELISLYSLLHEKDKQKLLIENMENINKQRVNISSYCKLLTVAEIRKVFSSLITKEADIILPQQDKLKIVINKKTFNPIIQKSLKDKIKRVLRITEKEGRIWNDKDLSDHFETGLQSALYFHCRDIYNKDYDINKISLPEYIANWYYVREFCYSSMFRFAKNGNFNVPYGGIGYNSKDFMTKVEVLKSNKTLHNLLRNTEVNKMDFEDLFKKYNYFNEDDFIFLDPPYDSEFSQYNKEGDFDKKEQIRLRDTLLNTKAQIMVVIKETDFIYELYKDDFKIEKFDKKYMTNMRNRNDKDVKHLIITNY